MTIDGTEADIDTILARGVTYALPHDDYNDNNTGEVVLTVTVNDRGSSGTDPDPPATGSLTDTETITISVAPVNDPPQFLPIDLETDLDARTARAEIPGVLTSTGRPHMNEFTGDTFDIALARKAGSMEFTYAELGLGTTRVTGEIEMAFDDTWALFVVHHFDQEGLVRERPRLTAWLGA